MIDPLNELALATALRGCRLLPGSRDKRLIRQAHAQLTTGLGLTPNQREWLYRLAFKYRAQLGLTPEQIKIVKCRYEPEAKHV